MKKRLSSVIVSIVLVMMLLTVPTFANPATIQLTANRDEVLNVAVGEEQILDLNGYSMSGNIVNKGTLAILDTKNTGKVSVTGNNVILNTGTLTIDGGTFDALSHGKAALYNDLGGNVTINNGKFLRSNENGKNSSTSGENSFYNILNHGVMTINGGDVLQTGKYSSLVSNGWQDGNQNTAGKDSKLTINGGIFSGGLNTIKNDDYGNLKITGGTFKNVAQASFLNWNIAEITGGTFSSDNGVILNGFLNETMDKGQLTISGGTFNSGNTKTVVSKMGGSTTIGTIVISGGKFNNSIGVDVKAGYKVYPVNGINTVAPMTTKIELSTTSLELEVGKTAQLKSTLTPSQTLDTVTYSSNDETVATVNSAGLITAKKDGTVTITASSNGLNATCIVTVKTKKVEEVVIPDEIQFPSIEASNQTHKVQVGIEDKVSKQTILNNVSDVLNDILKGNLVPNSIMSPDTIKAVQQALKDGKEITTVIENKLVDKKDVDKELVNKVNALVTLLEEKNGTNATITQFLDLGILLSTDGQTLGTLDQLDKPIEFTIGLPEELEIEGKVFYIVRVHDNVAEKIPVTRVGRKAKFKTDKFSTYALVYEEKTSAVTDNKVKTDDNSQMTLFANIVGLSLTTMVLVVLFKKRDQLLRK
ncbi:MAG: Ig-like domain-containing protein [Coprobacillus sp.]